MNHLDRYLATAACTFTRVATRVIPNRHLLLSRMSTVPGIVTTQFEFNVQNRTLEAATTHSCAIRAW